MTSAIYTNAANMTPEAATEATIAEFLREHGEIEMILPVVLGLMITSRFQLRGAQALLANLLVGSIVRQVLLKLKYPEADEGNYPGMSATAPKESNQHPETISTATGTWGGYEIIHSIPGRVRLKIPQLANNGGLAKRLLKTLNEDEYVTGARVNLAALCLVINYEAKDLADWELGLRLINLINAAQAETPA